MSKTIIKRKPIYDDIKDWPIFNLYQRRKPFISKVDEFAKNRVLEMHPNGVEDLIAQTLYLERIRMKETPWKVDPPTDKTFWNKMRSKLLASTLLPEGIDQQTAQTDIVGQIVHRYSEEIAGGFSKPTFLFARRFLTIFFTRLLNVAAPGSFGIFRTRHKLHERIQVYGEIDSIRELFKHGTVIVVPTHFSNLDSIMIGFAMDEIMGLPAFSYGAGLNLYNSGPFAYFMNRLGAYRVDRRKKNSIYLETLKSISLLSIYQGVNSLFFPGGTRSRAGNIEKKLKMGLLGTAMEAQRKMCQDETKKKVFIVPAVISYHFVLEAKFMIEEHLKLIGKEQYIQGRDNATSIRQWTQFMWRFFSQKNDIVINFGKPFDVLGNFVNDQGESIDKFERKIDIADYFKSRGVVTADLQKENEYTKILADRIVERFYAENIVLHSHVVAFAAFRLLVAHHPKLDLFELLRLPDDDYYIPFQSLKDAVEAVIAELVILSEAGKLHLSSELHENTDYIIRDGIRRLTMFHINKPLHINKIGDVVSEDFKTLHYYHNRLSNYGIERKIHWLRFPIVYKSN